MEDETTAKIATAITESQANDGAKTGIRVARDDLQYAVRVLQARAAGCLNHLFWGGKTGSSWTVEILSD